MTDLEAKINSILLSLKTQSSLCKKPHDFLLLRSEFLGKDSEIKNLLKTVKDLPHEDRQKSGKLIQNTADDIEKFIKDMESNIPEEKIDAFLPISMSKQGSQNIITKTINEIKNIFLQMGYKFEEAPEIDTEFRNFTAVNVHAKHPCRDAHQSFFLDNGKLLRTQTSNIQSYLLEKYQNDMKIFTIGRTYRRDSDATHVPMFHQIEGFCVNPKASVQMLFKELKTLLSNFFEIKNPELRIRPSFFPYTEPSYEIDMKFGDRYLEILGCGIIHRNVFKFSNREPELGFAFGCGVERFAMVKHNIKDIREVYNDNAFIVEKIGVQI